MGSEFNVIPGRPMHPIDLGRDRRLEGEEVERVGCQGGPNTPTEARDQARTTTDSTREVHAREETSGPKRGPTECQNPGRLGERTKVLNDRRTNSRHEGIPRCA